MTADVESFASVVSIAGTFAPEMGQPAEEQFLDGLEEIDRAARFVARRAGLEPGDADDLSATVKLRLIEDDYAILRRWDAQSSSLATFLTVVLRNLLSDRHARTHGRWRPSAEAERLGEVAVLTERLIRRDRRAMDEALPMIRALDPTVTRDDLDVIVARLPERAPRPRAVDLAVAEDVPARDAADHRLLEEERRRLTARVSGVVRERLAGLGVEDRLLIRFRFGSAMTIADIARMLRLPQRPLYRRIEAVLKELRGALIVAGLDAAALSEVLDAPVAEMDLGLEDRRS